MSAVASIGRDAPHADQQSLEDYLLLILSDSALPTGGFVASSGLESFVQHGFITANTDSRAPASGQSAFSLLSFVQASLTSYAHLNLPFFNRAHDIVWLLRTQSGTSSAEDVVQALQALVKNDYELEAMLLNHVARRASKAQGIALLTLYSRAFTADMARTGSDPSDESVHMLMDRLKGAARGRSATFFGHLPTCFAILCVALGLSLRRARYLHLFLQARAILSSAVRLNLVGPYAAQRALLFEVRNIVDQVSSTGPAHNSSVAAEPATTWPLGEILAARHDQLHSRIFNS